MYVGRAFHNVRLLEDAHATHMFVRTVTQRTTLEDQSGQ